MIRVNHCITDQNRTLFRIKKVINYLVPIRIDKCTCGIKYALNISKFLCKFGI